MIVHQKWITREDVRANPASIYIFGDNVRRVGYGGQAAAMRGEPNAYGIPTKINPYEDFHASHFAVMDAYWDWCFEDLQEKILHHPYSRVVWPADGIGTGLSRMAIVAPKLSLLLDTKIRRFMAEMGASDKQNASPY